METIPGAIVIYSCQKHKNTRLKDFKLPKEYYNGWKVLVILGNPELESEYEVIGNEITIRCEDGYIHLLKKVILSMKIIMEMYTITYGILRCGDDLYFNENNMKNFFNTIKNYSVLYDYVGRINQIVDNITPKIDTFMLNYYLVHPEESPVSLDEMEKMITIPHCTYISGVINYFSVHTCHVLVDYMSNPEINWNVFYKDENDCYPFIIEDVGIGYILQKERISPANFSKIYTDNLSEFVSPLSSILAYHSNKYK